MQKALAGVIGRNSCPPMPRAMVRRNMKMMPVSMITLR